MHKLTHDRLIQVLNYEPATGVFSWKVRISIRVKSVGAVAGSLRPDGYFEIGIDGENILAHRLAWFFTHGSWPQGQIDHKDLDKTNNRLNNLRLATHGQNVQNTGARKNNSSGYKGVHFVKQLGRWQARIMSNKRLHILGYFDTAYDAHLAYVEKAKALHGKFARS